MRKLSRQPFQFFISSHPLTKISLILLGCIFCLFLLMKLSVLHNRFFLSPATTVNASDETDPHTPTFIRIPRLDVSQVIRHSSNPNEYGYSVYQGETLTADEKHATILYGEQTAESFGDLSRLKKGDLILILTKDGILHSYYVWNIFTSPLTSFLPQRENALYLTTESRFSFQKRTIVEAVEITN